MIKAETDFYLCVLLRNEDLIFFLLDSDTRNIVSTPFYFSKVQKQVTTASPSKEYLSFTYGQVSFLAADRALL